MSELKASRELDMLIEEKVMGGEWRKVNKYVTELYSTNGDKLVVKDRGINRYIGYLVPDLPAYSTDIAAAWQVVEALWERGWNIDVSLYVAWHSPGFENGERLYRCAGEYRRKVDTSVIQWAKSTPLAICLAAMEVARMGEERGGDPCR